MNLKLFNWITYLYGDKKYVKTLISLSFPIILQNLIISSMNLIDNMMVGRLGDNTVSGVAAASQISFILLLFVFGLSTGISTITAQFYGKNDILGIKKTIGIGIICSLVIGVIFNVATVLFPRQILGLYTSQEPVITAGQDFLVIMGFTSIFFAITFCLSSTLRSIHKVVIPTIISAVCVVLNTALNFILIFGMFGLPAMGAKGSATATLIARIIEFMVIIIYVLFAKTQLSGKISEYFKFTKELFISTTKIAFPVLFNEAAWGIGISVYVYIYVKTDSSALAATMISSSIINFFFVICLGLASATLIITGNNVGAEDIKTAKSTSRHALLFSITIGIPMSIILFLNSEFFMSFYKISTLTKDLAINLLIINSVILPLKFLNTTLVVGVLRGGGDTVFSAVLDVITVWFIGIPVAIISAFVFKLPVIYVVILSVTLDESTKCLIGVIRFKSNKWIKNLVKELK